MSEPTFRALCAELLSRWIAINRTRAALAQPESAADNTRQAVYAAVAEALGGSAYDCLRVWEAWGYGTMGPDDFYLVANDEDRVAEIADAAIEAIRRTTPKPGIIPKPQPPGGRLIESSFAPFGYRPNPSRPGANPPPRNP